MKRRLIGGFTLLEVTVAVAILGIALTAIFASEAGAIRAAARARHMTTATILARCKMAEIEEQMAIEGLPVVSEDGEDECCEDGEQPGFRCEWSVERVELPDSVDIGGEEGDPLGIGGDHAGDSASGADVENALAGAAGGDAIGSYAVQFAWPVIRPSIEEQVRRASVRVIWGPDDYERTVEVSQYLVGNPPDDGSGGGPPPGGIGSPASNTGTAARTAAGVAVPGIGTPAQ